MPRYLVERTFPQPLAVSPEDWGPTRCAHIVQVNTDAGVTWLYSYVSDDRHKTVCVYEGPSPEAVRRAADRNRLPIDKITRVTVLDPYTCR